MVTAKAIITATLMLDNSTRALTVAILSAQGSGPVSVGLWVQISPVLVNAKKAQPLAPP
jgi:hypothetical protein